MSSFAHTLGCAHFSSIVGFVSSFDFLPREESGTLVQLGEVEDSETARRM